jgi:protein dithiol oxidoreductase (disulfide-forming)
MDALETAMLKNLFLAIAVIAIALPAYSQVKQPVLGKDYLELSNLQPTETGNKIEVVEFFWYRCPHCYALEPSLEAWVKQLPPDTQFRLIPAVFNEEWAIDARLHYALEVTGNVERLHQAFFNAVNSQGGATLRGQAYLNWAIDWVAKQGVDRAKFEAALRSFTVDSKVKRAAQISQAYRLDGVPALAVQGRYVISAEQVGAPASMLTVADYVLSQVRKSTSVASGDAKKSPAKAAKAPKTTAQK